MLPVLRFSGPASKIDTFFASVRPLGKVKVTKHDGIANGEMSLVLANKPGDNLSLQKVIAAYFEQHRQYFHGFRMLKLDSVELHWAVDHETASKGSVALIVPLLAEMLSVLVELDIRPVFSIHLAPENKGE